MKAMMRYTAIALVAVLSIGWMVYRGYEKMSVKNAVVETCVLTPANPVCFQYDPKMGLVETAYQEQLAILNYKVANKKMLFIDYRNELDKVSKEYIEAKKKAIVELALEERRLNNQAEAFIEKKGE